MVLDTKKYQELMDKKNMAAEDISRLTGLTVKSVNGILINGYSSVDAQERMASALDVPVREIVKEEQLGFDDNVIEFQKNAKTATLSISQGRYKSRIKELAQSHPDECEIVAENEDGSMCAHVPAAWIRINPSRELSEETKEIFAERARNNFHNN